MDVNLSTYISFCRGKGFSDEAIKDALIKANWKEEIVNEALAKPANPAKKSINLKMWTGPIFLAITLLLSTNIYNFFYFGQITTKSIVEATAGAAALMIGISYSLSSMSFYFNFLDSKLAYRKEIGLIGYYLAVTYALLLTVTVPQKYLTGFSKNLVSADFILGLSALGILTAMAIVSNNKIMVKVTPAVTRKILRFGYVAYFLLILRAIILERPAWVNWAANLDGLPPARLIVTLFASFVIILRIFMAIKIYIKEHKKQY